MKEKNIYIANPNGKNIIIPKRNKKIENMYDAFLELSCISERMVYLYFYSFPEENIKFGLNCSDLCSKMQIQKSSYHKGIKTLIDKGYLQLIDNINNTYIFIEKPNNDKTKFSECFINNNTPKKSQGIILIKNLLDINDIIYEAETVFSDCIFSSSGFYAYFDLFVNNNYIIEYDGKQHFKPVDFWGGEENFQKQRKRDLTKNKYCFENNIPLIRIPYTIKNIDINDLKLETTRFLLTPENEQEYYESRK